MILIAEMLSSVGKKMSWWPGFEIFRSFTARTENYETRDRDLNSTEDRYTSNYVAVVMTSQIKSWTTDITSHDTLYRVDLVIIVLPVFSVQDNFGPKFLMRGGAFLRSASGAPSAVADVALQGCVPMKVRTSSRDLSAHSLFQWFMNRRPNSQTPSPRCPPFLQD
jgi:hypothetical protein